jgi:serine/threonine-protein kinase
MAPHTLKPDADELPSSALVDNVYRIVRLIGRGGMGSVYEAEDIRLGRPVALKVLRSDLAKQLQADERFIQEAKILARIRSPFVATVYSIGATDTMRTYIAMEYIDGESLGDLLDRERWLKLARACKIALRVCEALMEAHKLGIIHRDLKPDNILLTRLGSVEDYVKVVDLGLAKHIQQSNAGDNPRLTQARLVVGTPAYMSPEQAAGQEVGPQSDLYSLGVIFYEMITGFLPIDGETPQDFLRAHQLQPPVPLAQRRSDLAFPPQVDAFFRKVLAKNAADRPQDAAAFVKELEKLEGLSAESRTARATSGNQQPRSTRKTDSVIGPTLDSLEERLDRAKDRVRLELMGVAAPGRGVLYDTLDTFVANLSVRADPPVVVRVRVPPVGSRLPLACFFEDVRIRAGLFDDDPPSLARRKLLSWVQTLMPDRPDRASQVAHLIGLFLRVDFPDSPHLSHARAVPEVARMAGGAALADALRGIAGRSPLVVLIERADHLSETEIAFVRRLVRQLGTAAALVVAGWLARSDDVPASFAGILTPQAVAKLPPRPSPNYDRLIEAQSQRALRAALRIGSPLWPDLLEAAVGAPVSGALARLVAAGALRTMPTSRLSTQVEYQLGDYPDSELDASQHEDLDLHRALSWMATQSVPRPDVWVGRLAELEAMVGDLLTAGTHARQAAELMRTLGALPEATAQFEIARAHALALRDVGHLGDAAGLLAESAVGLSMCLSERGERELASDRAREAIEELQRAPSLREEEWIRLGVPLMAIWASEEAACGRGAPAIEPLAALIKALQASTQPAVFDELPKVRLALGRCQRAANHTQEALDSWGLALRDVPLLGQPVLLAELSMLISEAHRSLADGERAVQYARKALSAARDARNLILEVEALRCLALALREIGELDDAEAQLGEALNALGRVDRQRLLAEISVLLSAVLQSRGALDEADAALAKSCRAYAALPDLGGLSDALRQRGEIQMAHGIYTRALAFAEEASRQAVLANDISMQIKAMLLAARASAAAGEARTAHQTMEEAFQLVAPDTPTTERADCMVVLADLLEAGVLTSDRDTSSLLEEAAEIYRELGATSEADRLSRRLKAMSRAADVPRPVVP